MVPSATPPRDNTELMTALKSMAEELKKIAGA